MDDEIIHSWCFHNVEYFDSTPSAAIIILDKDLEGFLSLRSQHILQPVLHLLFLSPHEIWKHDMWLSIRAFDFDQDYNRWLQSSQIILKKKLMAKNGQN